MKRDFSAVKLCVLVSSVVAERPPWRLAAEAVAGGADCIQLREKNITDRRLLETARACRDACGEAIFIVNDRPDIAVLSEADGVHVGQDDLQVDQVRRIVGDELLIGVSVSRVEQVAKAERAGADYLGAGCIFPTATKSVAVMGLEFLREAGLAANGPVLAIGGINVENASQAVSAGASGVAVSSAVIAARDVRDAARLIRAAVVRALRSK